MSTITINIGGSEKTASVAGPSEFVQTPLSAESADGGAPQFSQGETASTAQVDIGGPPAWLGDALKSADQLTTGGTSSDAFTDRQNGDGGAANVVLN